MSKLRSENEIRDSWDGGFSTPILSICCAAYNHEAFIESALIGFLKQVTNFPFEILIHDDASTDATAKIIKEYEVRYPEIVKPIYQVENQFSRGRRISPYLIGMSEAEFIAVCDGDDYWNDENKLQRQVDFLRKNPEYVVSGHDSKMVDKNNKTLSGSRLSDEYKRDFSADELKFGQAWILTQTMCFRNVVRDNAMERHMVINSDTFLISLLGCVGKYKYHNDIMPSAYRVHDGGIWSTLEKQSRIDHQINTFYWIAKYYTRIGDSQAGKIYRDKVEARMLEKFTIAELTISIFTRIKDKVVSLVPLQVKRFVKSSAGLGRRSCGIGGSPAD